MVQKSMSGTAAFVHILEGSLRPDSISKLMNTKWTTYVFAMKSLMFDTKCVSCQDSSSYFSLMQTEEKQNYFNFMSNTPYFSSLELCSLVSVVYSHLDLCSRTEQSSVKLFYLLL